MTDPSRRGLGGFVCCVIDTEQYALAGDDVRLVSRAEAVKAEHGRGSFVGTLKHGREVVPVYSLAGLFGREVQPQLVDRHVIVTGGAHGWFGLLVDRIVRTPVVADLKVLSLPSACGHAPCTWFRGLLRLGEELSCLVLSPAGIDPCALAPEATAVQRATPSRSRRAVEHPDMVLTFRSTALPAVPANRFALAADRVGAIVQSLPTLPLPGAPSHVTGLAWWREFAVPILDIRPRRTAISPADQRFLIARAGANGHGGFVAFAIHADAALHRVTSEDRRQQNAGAPGSCARGVYLAGGETVALLDIAALAAPPSETKAVTQRAAAVV